MKNWLYHRVVLLSLGVLASCEVTGGGLNYTVTFEDSRGLEAGAPVVYRGVRIGEVTEVTVAAQGPVQVAVRIDPEHRNTVYREAWFVIESPGGVDGLRGKRQLVVRDRPGRRTAIQDGDVIEGSEGALERSLERLKQAWAASAEKASELKQELGEIVKDVRDAPETQEFLESLEELGDEAKEIGREQYKEFRTEQLPELKRRAERIRDKLQEEGHVDKAREFWDHFNRWLEETTEELRRSEAEEKDEDSAVAKD